MVWLENGPEAYIRYIEATELELAVYYPILLRPGKSSHWTSWLTLILFFAAAIPWTELTQHPPQVLPAGVTAEAGHSMMFPCQYCQQGLKCPYSGSLLAPGGISICV